MRVLVTGGTGFVGAHTVKAVVDAGHDVTLLVRSAARIQANIEPLGVDLHRVDHVVGDMTDEAAVAAAADGADAVIHGAAVVTLERRHAGAILAANPRGAEVVIGTALQRGIDPIIHVSSLAALFDARLDVLTTDTPPTRASTPYARSKAAAETWVRARQAEGAPIAITYPGGVAGPSAGDAFGEMAEALRQLLVTGAIPTADGALSIVDVRDIAAVHTALLTPGCGPRRYTCGGHTLTMTELAGEFRAITGRRFPVIPVPGVAYRALGRAMDALMRVVPISSIYTHEAMETLTRWVPSDDRATAADLGIKWRDPGVTLADAFRSLRNAGRVRGWQVGRLGSGSGLRQPS